MRNKVFQYPNYNTHVVVRTLVLDGGVLWSLDVVDFCCDVLVWVYCACNQYLIKLYKYLITTRVNVVLSWY